MMRFCMYSPRLDALFFLVLGLIGGPLTSKSQELHGGQNGARIRLAADTSKSAHGSGRGRGTLHRNVAHGSTPNKLQSVGVLSNRLAQRSLRFIENRGQFPDAVKFKLSSAGRTVWLTKRAVVLDLPADRTPAHNASSAGSPTNFRPQAAEPHEVERLAIHQEFIDANPRPEIEAKTPKPGIYNYFIGNDPAKWRTDVKGYAEVVYRNVWDGIDVRLYGNGPDLEQEFVVAPGADLGQVRIAYKGVDGLALNADGSLRIRTGFGELRETSPNVYQDIAGERVPVKARFRLTDQNTYTFDVEHHRAEYALVIDPTLLYSTYLGGSTLNGPGNYGPQVANGIAVDSSGSAYVTGFTSSTSFPTTPGAYQTNSSTLNSGFVTKLSPLGDQLVYSTYLGGTAVGVAGEAIAVDSSGAAYVTGYASNGFPTTANAYDTSCSNVFGNNFVTKLTPAGDNLIYSTCIGGHTGGLFVGGGQEMGLALDASGKAYVTGSAECNLPTTPGAFQTTCFGLDASVFVIDPSASGAASVVYATYLHGTNNASGGLAIAVDAYGDIYVTGATDDSGFPVTAGAYQTTFLGNPCAGGGQGPCASAFVAKLNPNISGPSSLIYATYLGGTLSSSGQGIAVDSEGSAYITGYTGGLPPHGLTVQQFPSTPGAFFPCGTSFNRYAFVTKLNAAGNALAYSTCLGGGPSQAAPTDAGTGIAVDINGNAYVTGHTRASTFPLTANAYQSTLYFDGSGYDGFVTELNPSGSGLIYSSFLGGPGGDTYPSAIAIDAVGDAYVTGWTSSLFFPITPFAYQPAMQGPAALAQDAFVTKFPLGAPQGLSILAISPIAGGNAGAVTARIAGSGFHAGVNVQLNCGGQSIVGTNVSVGAGGRLLTDTFNLTGALPGTCALAIANPDGTSATLSQAFAVQQGGAPNIHVYLTGAAARESEAAVSATNAVYFVTASNTGNVDSTGSIVGLPLNSPFTLTSASPPGLVNLAQGSSADQFEVWQSVAPIAAAASQTLAATATAGMTAPSICGANNALPGVQACFSPVNGIDSNKFASCIGNTSLWKKLLLTASCTTAIPGCLTVETGSPFSIIACLVGIAGCVDGTADLINTCMGQAETFGPQICISGDLPCVEPRDPNELVGPSGVGGQHWIAGASALTYAVSFGNEPTATAPAQQVVVTEPLGMNVNLATLSLPIITIPNGTTNVQVPIPPGSFVPAAGVNEFTTNVDLRPTQSLLVGVDAKLNPASQTLTWTFTSIDPSTGAPPPNPLVGFLSPGAGGSVSFSVTPIQSLITGSRVTEQASVVFDANPPMSTPTWFNTLDNTPPVSQVSALPATSTCPSFRVSWSGTDIGSGLGGFTIYASDNGGPFTAWLSNTTAASADYTGAVGHAYSFYSIATDLTGNLEPGKTSGEASTEVTAAGPCGPPSLSGQVTNVSQSGTTVTVSLQLTNTGFTSAQALNISKITLRTLSGSGMVTLASPALPAAEGSLAIGASTTVTLTLNVPTTVTRFSLTESGNLQDGAGNRYNYSIAQTVIP